jgi:hypothetical protein
MNWRKSTHCVADSNCIEVAWRTAACAGNGACVEIAWRTACVAESNCIEVGHHPAAVLVRDSTDPDGPRLTLTRQAFGRLLTTIKETR